jgi:hypothetical protein
VLTAGRRLPMAAVMTSIPIPVEAVAGLHRRVEPQRCWFAGTVLAPMLPALVLLGLCVAGLNDPPEDVHTSRLHVTSPVIEQSAAPR